MSWTPAVTLNDRFSGIQPDWLQLQALFDDAINLEPLPRRDWSYLETNYILDRPGYGPINIASAKSILPETLRHISLGPYEIDFIDFLLHYDQTRVMALCAPRGAGKTSFLHYCEAALVQSGVVNCPIFLIVGNLAQLEQNTDIGSTNHDLSLLIAAEADQAARQLSGNAQDAVARFSSRLREAASPADARECFRHMATLLEAKELRRLVLIFDNLDHLQSSTISYILDFARAVYVVSRVACVVCLRPNCLAGIAARGDARAFFEFQIDLPGPNVADWIRQLGRRMATQAEKKRLAAGNSIILAGSPVTAQQIRTCFETLASCLERQAPQEDVLALLQAICADDTRHLVILFRRLLAHRTFPVAKLLAGVTPFEYHPFPALLSGQNLSFIDDPNIPNLLVWHQDGVSAPSLILFRLLTLLARNIPVPIAEIEARMALFEYSKETVHEALRVLHRPLIIRGTDRDSFMPEEPSEIYLTDAGEHYLHHLLRNSDYLLQAAADVPGKHELFLKSFEKDPVRLSDSGGSGC